jgi:hypothetical protein
MTSSWPEKTPSGVSRGRTPEAGPRRSEQKKLELLCGWFGISVVDELVKLRQNALKNSK